MCQVNVGIHNAMTFFMVFGVRVEITWAAVSREDMLSLVRQCPLLMCSRVLRFVLKAYPRMHTAVAAMMFRSSSGGNRWSHIPGMSTVAVSVALMNLSHAMQFETGMSHTAFQQVIVHTVEVIHTFGLQWQQMAELIPPSGWSAALVQVVGRHWRLEYLDAIWEATSHVYALDTTLFVNFVGWARAYEKPCTRMRLRPRKRSPRISGVCRPRQRQHRDVGCGGCGGQACQECFDPSQTIRQACANAAGATAEDVTDAAEQLVAFYGARRRMFRSLVKAAASLRRNRRKRLRAAQKRQQKAASAASSSST